MPFDQITDDDEQIRRMASFLGVSEETARFILAVERGERPGGDVVATDEAGNLLPPDDDETLWPTSLLTPETVG